MDLDNLRHSHLPVTASLKVELGQNWVGIEKKAINIKEKYLQFI